MEELKVRLGTPVRIDNAESMDDLMYLVEDYARDRSIRFHEALREFHARYVNFTPAIEKFNREDSDKSTVVMDLDSETPLARSKRIRLKKQTLRDKVQRAADAAAELDKVAAIYMKEHQMTYRDALLLARERYPQVAQMCDDRPLVQG